jgi:hypothetical protein
MNETVVAHARRGFWLIRIVGWGLPLLIYILLLESTARDWLPLLPTMVATLFVFLLLLIPLIRVESKYKLLTDRSPAEIRNEIQSVENPLAIWPHALADEDGVEIHENGGTYERTILFGLRTVRVRCEAEQDQNGDLLVQMWKNGIKAPVATMSVEPADGTGSLVTVDGFTSRINLRRLFLLWVRKRSLAAAYKACGYEIINDKTRIGLREFAFLRSRED